MYRTIKSFKIPTYSPLVTYPKWAVVYSSATKNYFFSISDYNIENADSIASLQDGTNWINMETATNMLLYFPAAVGSSFGIANSLSSSQIKAVNQLEVVDKTPAQSRNLNWQGLVYEEYRALLSFLEYRSCLGFITQTAFGKTYNCLVSAITKSQDNYNKYSISCSIMLTELPSKLL